LIVYLDGEYLAADEARVPLFDGGYLYGDGLFETLRIYRGRPFDLDGHLARLSRQCRELSLSHAPEAYDWAGVIARLLERNGLSGADARCRLTVSRRLRPDDPLPLAAVDRLPATVSAFVTPLPAELPRWQREGIAVHLMPAGSGRGGLAELKTLNYLPTLLALREAHRRGCVEALLRDAAGHVLEGATSNLFLVAGGTLVTPPTAQGLLPGRTRALVLAAAASLELPVREQPVTTGDLWSADEVFLSGSVKEVVPVVRIDDRAVADGRAGTVTRRLQTAYRRGVEDTLGGS